MKMKHTMGRSQTWRLGLLGLLAAISIAACSESSGGGTLDVNATDVLVLDTGVEIEADTQSQAEAVAETTLGDSESPDSGDTSAPELPSPGGCCSADEDCASGAQCIGLSIGDPGICIATPPPGECYEARDCEDGQACQGAHPTICVMSSLPSTGTCVEMPAYCCYDDADCEEGKTCEGTNEAIWGPGECHGQPEPGRCYRDAHCAEGTSCLGATPCGCLVDCYWAGPGYCVPPGETCCFSDGDCAEDRHCVGGHIGGPPGHCKPPLGDGSCWGDKDCGGDGHCEGADMCPCDALCDMEDHPGVCVGGGETCCEQDDECAPGFTCASFPEALGLEGACKPEQVDGMCWDHDDCGVEGICIGAVPCPCGDTIDGVGCDIPGTCYDKAAYGCCTSDDDCDPDAAGDSVCGLGSTCVAPLSFGQCWTDGDCYETQACTGVTICPCGMLCTMPTLPGSCTPLPQGCCYDDAGCDEGFVCRGGGSTEDNIDHMPGGCVPDPEGAACPYDAACCWDPIDCGDSAHCEGAIHCACNELCYSCGACMEDQIGQCVDGPVDPCCFIDEHCPGGHVCAGGGLGGYPGSCKVPDPEGGCWRNADCSVEGEICHGEQICPCDALCDAPDEPGHCTMAVDLDCCFGPDDCSPLFVCVPEGPDTSFGVCKPRSMGDGCWFDSDCAETEDCLGIFVCPCDADCAEGDSIGECAPK
jgi:hypothetical protein